MKFFGVLILLFLSMTAASAQEFPPVGTIDFYGLRTVSRKQIREVLPIKEGDAAIKSKEESDAIIERLSALPNVVEVKINFGCCDNNGKSNLYIGIREKDSPSLNFRAAPNGKIRLPEIFIKTGEEFSEAHEKAILKGDAIEDRSEGHSLMKNAEARRIQEKFIPLADQNLPLLRKVLRESSDAEHRALAAEVIAYYKDKRAVVPDLVAAVNDENGTVRNNAIRALGVIAVYAQIHPEKKIKILFESFAAMLNSIEWTDRNKSSLVLGELTAKRDVKLLALLREKALDSLIEMARWKIDGHAIMPFVILGRIGGLSEDEIGQSWTGGRREEFINRVRQNLKIK